MRHKKIQEGSLISSEIKIMNRDICTPRADSCCLIESNNILWSNYPSIKRKTLKILKYIIKNLVLNYIKVRKLYLNHYKPYKSYLIFYLEICNIWEQLRKYWRKKWSVTTSSPLGMWMNQMAFLTQRFRFYNFMIWIQMMPSIKSKNLQIMGFRFQRKWGKNIFINNHRN